MKLDPAHDERTGRVTRLTLEATSFADQKLLHDLNKFLGSNIEGEIVVTTVVDGKIEYTRYLKDEQPTDGTTA